MLELQINSRSLEDTVVVNIREIILKSLQKLY